MDYKYISVSREIPNEEMNRAQQLRKNRSVINARRRREEVARQKRALLFTAIAVVVGIIMAFSVLGTSAQANGADRASEISYKCYKEVYVQSGDTLWMIAEEYTDGSVNNIQACISEIREINDLGNLETIKAGSYIVVPYYSNGF